MALGQFGSLTYGKVDKQTYDFALSNDFGMNALLKNFNRFSNPIVGGNQPQEKALENLAGEGHVEVLS